MKKGKTTDNINKKKTQFYLAAHLSFKYKFKIQHDIARLITFFFCDVQKNNEFALPFQTFSKKKKVTRIDTKLN